MKTKKVLIISDSVIDRANVKEILLGDVSSSKNDENEFVVYEASNGTDALDFLLTSNNIIDAIILDIAMPTMNGRQFLKILLNNPELKATPIIAVCPRDDIESETYAIANGAADVIYKPFVKEIFLGRINNIFIHGNYSLERIENSLLNESMQTQDQLQGIMDNMDGGVAMLEFTSQEKHNIIYLNNGFYDLFNYSKEEFESKKLNFINTLNIEKADELLQKINRSLITKEKFSVETKAYQKNKTEIYLQVHGSVLSNQKNDFPVVLLIIYDISDLKKYEFELVQTNKKLKYRANYDVLTNIYNRGAFLDEVEELLEKNPNIEYVMMLFNIEKFKAINEILGVKTGDEILIRFAEYLKEELKDNAVYGRIEADHFAVCLEHRALDEDKLTNQLDHAFDEMHLNHKILIYAGAYIIKDRRLEASQILDRASLALRGNKHNYLHRLNYYDDFAHSSLLEEQEVVAEMQEALINHEFEVYLQAIYSIERRCITKAEALVRWRHPQKGLLYPGKFIPIFEKNGFIIELDYYVWEEVCKYIRSRMDRGLAPINISVNISRINIYRNDLAERIYNLTKKYDIPREMLELEITESAYSSNPELLRKAISALKEKGFTVLMDDFGSAYSSLNSLKDLNFDILKIDMKFIEDFDTSKKSSSILSSIISMTKALDMKIVAEGVETIEQFNFLSKQKCDLIQGYLISKPVDFSEFESKPLNFTDNRSENKANKYDFLYDNSTLNKNEIDNIFGAFVILEVDNDNMHIINYNKSFLDVLGYSDLDIDRYYNDFKALVLEEDYKRFYDDLSSSVVSKHLIHSSFRMFGKDGSIRNLDTHIHFIGKNDNKKLICLNVVPIAKGIDDKNLDFIRQKSMLEVIPSMIAFASVPKNVTGPKDLNVIYINDGTRKFNGYTFEEYMEYSDNDCLVLVHPDDKKNVASALHDFFKKQVPARVYFRIQEKDSTDYKWLALYLSIATSTNDTIYFSFAIVDVFNLQDIISLNCQGEKYTIKEYLKRLYDDYPNMLVQLAFIDGKYKVIFANEKFLKFVGYESIEALIGRFDKEAFPFVLENQKLSLSQTLSHILETGESYNFTKTFLLDDNKQYLINISAHRIVNVDGNYILHLLINDVTTESNQKAEEELSKFVSIFGAVYDSIYECDVENDTYTILKSPIFNEGIRGAGIKQMMNRVLNEYIYEEDLIKAKQFSAVLFENNPSFEKENAKLRLYHNDKVTYGLFNITRISRSIFMFGFNILNEERLEIETYQELEKDLRESKKNEELYRSAIESMGVCLIRFNVKQNYMSPTLKKYNLFKCKDFEAFKNADDIVQFSDRETFKNFIKHVEEDGKAEAELRLRTVDDEYFYNVVALNKISELDGVVNYYGYIKDIHKVKIFNEIGNAKEKLAGEKNRVLATLVNSLPVGLGVYEIENNKVYPVYLTNFLLDILELSYSSIDRSIKEHIPVDEVSDEKYNELLEYAKSNKSYIYKRYIEMNNGSIKWISVALSLKVIEDRLRVYTSVLDVTETISLDSQASTNNNYLRELITSSNSIYYEYEIEKDKLEYFTLIGNKFESNEIKGYYNYFKASSNIQEEYKERVLEALDAIKNKRVANDAVECIAKFFGDYQWYKIEMNAILDETKKVVKVVGQIVNIDKEIIRRKEYVRLIERDQLSGLINRITAQKYIIEALKEENRNYAFMMIDIDSFKGLNDNYGHPFGDEIIMKVSAILKDLFENETSIASRFGGDEFVAFMQYEKESDLVEVINKMYERVYNISKDYLLLNKITLSVGIALTPHDASDFDNLFLKADEALYRAKTNGKNRYCWYDENM